MGKVVRFLAPHESSVVDEADAPLGSADVRIATLHSGISAGTELTAYRGSNPYLTKRWDPESKLFVPGGVSEAYPMDGWGYEEVGEVVEKGPDAAGIAVGQRVWGTWGHRGTTVMPAELAATQVLAPDVDSKIGIFSRIGAIALNTVHDADIHLGETVVVFGLGVPGQLVAQMAKSSGATVIGVDMIPFRRDTALRLGADHVLDAGAGQIAEQIRDLTDGRGADVAIEISGHYSALQEAIRSVAYSARVIAAGFYQGGGDKLFLGEEFHHNRVSVVGSQIFGVAPALKYRWTDHRESCTVIDLAKRGRLDILSLITREFDIDEAPEAFQVLDSNPADHLQIVLNFK